MVKSEAVITNAFHGTVFSIIFNKPFITIYRRYDAIERFNSLDYLFGVKDRLYINGQEINLDLLIKPLKINHKLLNRFKKNSINFIKDNLRKRWKSVKHIINRIKTILQYQNNLISYLQKDYKATNLKKVFKWFFIFINLNLLKAYAKLSIEYF